MKIKLKANPRAGTNSSYGFQVEIDDVSQVPLKGDQVDVGGAG
jgi:hypothetical protein